MNPFPLVMFYARRHEQIKKLVPQGQNADQSSHILLDVLEANAPILKKQFPQINEKGTYDIGLFDDFVETMKLVLAPS